jgi:hypothetical protein
MVSRDIGALDGRQVGTGWGQLCYAFNVAVTGSGKPSPEQPGPLV